MQISTPTTPRLLLSVPEAAKALGRISERTLFSLTASGEIRCVRIGRRVLYSVEELQRFIQQHEKGGEAK